LPGWTSEPAAAGKDAAPQRQRARSGLDRAPPAELATGRILPFRFPPGKSLPPPLPLLEQGVWYGRTVPRFCRLALVAHTAALAPATRAGGNSFQYRYGARVPGAGDHRPVAFDSRATDWACPVSVTPRLANVRSLANLRPPSLSFPTMETRRPGPNADGERPPFFF